jgi:tRNA(fMet)-specific endonuclease VapC
VIYCLDTNICIEAIGRDPAIVARLAGIDAGAAIISAIVFAELQQGLTRPGIDRDEATVVLERFIRAVPVVAFHDTAARLLSRLPIKCNRYNRLTAVHALALGATLVTHNRRDFPDVPGPGLALEDWP